MDEQTIKPETLAVHAGFEQDPLTGAVMPPIYQVSTYAQTQLGVERDFVYSRTDNPTRTPLQAALAELEYAQHALAFSSGMAAIDAVLNTLRAGDHVLAGDDLYGGTYRLFTRVAQERGLEFSFISLQNPASIAAEVRPNTKLIWFETPSNPLMRLIDIKAVSDAAHELGLKVCVDNTFMSPMLQNPLLQGADLVMHSITKYINGHSDVVMGCLMLNDPAWYERLKFLQNSIGAVPAPMDCFLVLRGIRTLAVRMKAHVEGAMRVAAWLEGHPKVDRVLYPGLASHPQHELALQQTSGGGGMISFYTKDGLATAQKLLQAVKIFKLAESLGGVESLIEHPGIMTHASVPQSVREAQGITDGLVRISVGIEHPDDLIRDLERAIG